MVFFFDLFITYFLVRVAAVSVIILEVRPPIEASLARLSRLAILTFADLSVEDFSSTCSITLALYDQSLCHESGNRPGWNDAVLLDAVVVD
jgi:hypothetical protein